MTTPFAVNAAEILLPSSDIGADVDFFVARLGFQLTLIFPADDPREAVLEGHGLRLRLSSETDTAPARLRLLMDNTDAVGDILQAPNGTIIEFADANPPMAMPVLKSELVIRHLAGEESWGTGRAGMQYRDLIPDRLGGRFIASHIRILLGGPVPDYVHFHKIRFQMIYCYKGWVKVAYEDQGEAMLMQAGDCFLQPPEIRHRVLECSDGMEVIEIGCPAEHETRPDPTTKLPTGKNDPNRDFNGQRFVFHQAADATWQPWRLSGFEARDIGFASATDGLAAVKTARWIGPKTETTISHQGEFLFFFILAGTITLVTDNREKYLLQAGDCASIPAGLCHCLRHNSDDLEILEVTLPADLPISEKENK